MNTMFVLGFRFSFESSSTFSVQAVGFISLLSLVAMSRKLCCLCVM